MIFENVFVKILRSNVDGVLRFSIVFQFVSTVFKSYSDRFNYTINVEN